MATCPNCGNTMERRRCLTCAAEAAKAQPHAKNVGGKGLLGALFLGLALYGLLVLGVANAGSSTSPKQAIEDAVAATKAAGTSTFTLSVNASSEGLKSKTVALSGSGKVDKSAKQSEVSITGPGVSVEMIVDGTDIYLRKGSNDAWVKASVSTSSSNPISNLIGGSSSFTPSYDSLQSAWGHATKAGSVVVGGHACTKYDIPVSTADVKKLLDSEMKGSAGAGLGQAFLSVFLKGIHINETMAIDNQSHYIRAIDETVSLSILGQSVNEQVNFELDNFGKPVTIDVPTSATTVGQLPSIL